MMQPGEYCAIITMDVEVIHRYAPRVSILQCKYRDILIVSEGQSRMEVTQQLIRKVLDLTQKSLDQSKSGILADGEPAIIFLSIDPN